jgi:hypothetical protein
MKVLFEDYTFNATSKQIVFNTTDTITLEQMLIVTNVTTNKIIYNFADPALGGTISNNVLTLTFDTTSMSNSNKLQIFLDNTFLPASEESIQYLKKIVQVLTPLATQDTQQRQRVAVDTIAAGTLTTVGTINAISTIGTLSTVSSVSNLVAIGGVDPRFQFIDAARLTYAQGIRNNLQFS